MTCVWYIDAHAFMKKCLSYDSSYLKFWFLFEVAKLDFKLDFNLFIFGCINIFKMIFLIYWKVTCQNAVFNFFVGVSVPNVHSLEVLDTTLFVTINLIS